MNKINGVIKDLSKFHSYTFTSIAEAVETIKTLYHESDVVFGEFITTIAINDCNLEDVITIVARCRKEIDGYDMIMIADDNGHVHLA